MVKFLTIYRRAGLVDHTVSLHDAVGMLGLTPGHVDRGGGEFTEVDKTGSAWSCGVKEDLIKPFMKVHFD